MSVVKNWLSGSGISESRVSQSHDLQWLEFNATVNELESLLLAEYWLYEHNETGKVTLGCDSYHLPKHVEAYVDFITPATATLELRRRENGASVAKRASPGRHPPPKPYPFRVDATTGTNPQKPCWEAVTPDCIKRM